MSELIAPDMAIGALALALAILYGAWHAYKEKNQCDASLLAAVGAVTLIGSAMAWIH